MRDMRAAGRGNELEKPKPKLEDLEKEAKHSWCASVKMWIYGYTYNVNPPGVTN